jgi:hypothetical protein
MAGRLTLFGPSGAPIVQTPPQAGLTASCLSEDGRHAALGTSRGEVRLLGDELSPGWERTVHARVMAAALDPLGQRLAVSDEGGGLTVFSASGREVWRASTPRALSHLQWAPETGSLWCAADYGLACLFSAEGGQAWLDAPVAHIGGLACTGDGQRLLAACFSEGVKCYGESQGRPTPLAKGLAARHVAISYFGDVIVTVGLDGAQLTHSAGDGTWLAEGRLPSPAVSLALDALGRWAVAALAAGELARYDW